MYHLTYTYYNRIWRGNLPCKILLPGVLSPLGRTHNMETLNSKLALIELTLALAEEMGIDQKELEIEITYVEE